MVGDHILPYPLTMHYEDNNQSILELVKNTIDRYNAGEKGVIDRLIEFKCWDGNLEDWNETK